MRMNIAVFLFAWAGISAAQGCIEGQRYPLYNDACLPQYYVCVGGNGVEQSCGSGLVFDESIGTCNWPTSVPSCIGVDGCVDDLGNPISGIFFTKSSDCAEGYYYECNKGTEVQMKCSGDDIYDMESLQCLDPSAVNKDCTENSIKDTTTPLPFNTTTPFEETTTVPSPAPIRANSYVGFVIDNTGSMGIEIEAVTEWITGCVDGVQSSCKDAPTGGWIIISYNDPMTTPVVGPTTDGQDILDEIETFYVYGGGDCPEMAMDGLSKVANAVPDKHDGCKIYLFTDATAKDGARMSEVTSLFETKGCSLIPVLTGCCGACPSPCDTTGQEYCEDHTIDISTEIDSGTSGFDKTQFYQIAQSTAGNIFVLDKPTNKMDMFFFLEGELNMGFCQSSQIAGPQPEGYGSKEDCAAAGMCWDKSLSRCYCTNFCA